jgi:CDP-diacylglycerol---serine O-phosphatidyltransferase
MENESLPMRRKGVYLLPNLFTTAALFAGFYAIVAAMQQQFAEASMAIFIAMVLDTLDGRVARMTNTQSAFGAQYDSLADMVSFGLAPSLVIYQWVLIDMGKLGWLAAFVYTAGAALRLARFNTQLTTADKHFFTGLPSPAAAALVAGLVWVLHEAALVPADARWIAFAVTFIAGLLMVSNLRYHSFKQIDRRGRVPFFVLVAIMLAIVFISLSPPQILFFGFSLYAISGVVMTLWLMRRIRRGHPGTPEPPPPQQEHK